MMTVMKTGLLAELYRKIGEELGLLDPHRREADAVYPPPTTQQIDRARAAMKRARARARRLGVTMGHEEIVGLIKAGRRF